MLMTIVCLFGAAFFNHAEKLKKKKRKNRGEKIRELTGSSETRLEKIARNACSGRRMRRATTTNSKSNPSSSKAFSNYIEHLLLNVPSWACLCSRRFSFSPLCYFLFSVLVINGNVYPCRPQNLNYQDKTQIYRAFRLSLLFSACAIAE